MDILTHTPPWVFLLFAYLAWAGARRFKPGVRSLPRIFIVPAIFIVWGLVGLFESAGDLGRNVLWWAAGVVIGFLLGFAGRISLQADKAHRLVFMSGSVLPLARVLVLFGAHYVLRVAAILHPDASAGYLNWDVFVSGAGAGYFTGWSMRFFASYARAQPVDLAKPASVNPA